MRQQLLLPARRRRKTVAVKYNDAIAAFDRC
jgi:hypothetical protein